MYYFGVIVVIDSVELFEFKVYCDFWFCFCLKFDVLFLFYNEFLLDFFKFYDMVDLKEFSFLILVLVFEFFLLNVKLLMELRIYFKIFYLVFLFFSRKGYFMFSLL